MSQRDDLVDFCEREHTRLFRVLLLYVGEPALAEELAQEALARACSRWDSVGQMEAPGAWVHRVAINLANSTFRRRRAERRARTRDYATSIYEPPDVAAYVTIHDGLQRLAPRRRTAVLLRHVAGLSVAESAAVMGVSEGAVRSLTSRGLAELRLELTDEEEASNVR